MKISNGEIEAALINVWKKVCYSPKGMYPVECITNITTLRGRYNNLVERNNKGVISGSEYTQERNVVTNNLIQIVLNNGIYDTEISGIEIPDYEIMDVNYKFIIDYISISDPETKARLEIVQNYFFDIGIVLFHGLNENNIEQINMQETPIIIFLNLNYINSKSKIKSLLRILNKISINKVFFIKMQDVKKYSNKELCLMFKESINSIQDLKEKSGVRKINKILFSSNTYEIDFLKKNNYIPILKQVKYYTDSELISLKRCINIYREQDPNVQDVLIEIGLLENPSDVIFLMVKAKIMIERKKYSIARLIIDHIIKKNPEYGPAYYTFVLLVIKQKTLNADLLSVKKHLDTLMDLYPSDMLNSKLNDLNEILIFENKENYL